MDQEIPRRARKRRKPELSPRGSRCTIAPVATSHMPIPGKWRRAKRSRVMQQTRMKVERKETDDWFLRLAAFDRYWTQRVGISIHLFSSALH